MWFWALNPGLLCLFLNNLKIFGVHVQLGCFLFCFPSAVFEPCRWRDSSANYGLVLDPFWADFPHVSRCCYPHPPIGSRSHIRFCPLQSQLLFFSLALTQSMPVGRLQSYVPTLPFPQFHIYSCSHNSLPRGPQILVGGEHHCWPILTGTTPPISFLTVLQSYLCIQIIQYPHTQHLQVTQLSANHICRFWHQSLQSKAAQQQWEGKNRHCSKTLTQFPAF